MTSRIHVVPAPSQQQLLAYDPLLDDVGYMTCMTLVLLGNYAQTGHLGGPLAYTPYNVAAHLVGPENGGLRYDYRRPKHPYCDKFMMAAGHWVPTCYALWMIMGQALDRKYQQTGDPRYHVDPHAAMLPIDALGFRRGAGALKTLLHDTGLEDHPLFAQAKGRGIRRSSGHAESTDLTNDVNGGPSGIGIATAAGKAAFWDIVGAPESPKIIALEGEFALTEGHAQELKTQALALQVGKRLRVMLSDNNAGIDDCLIGGQIGGVIASQFCEVYDLVDQWTSYGWNVFTLANGNDYGDVTAALKAMDEVDPHDRRPMVVIGKTIKGYWPAAADGKIPGHGGDQLVSYPSHPYALKMNSEYFVALATTFEKHYGVEFEGIRDGPVSDNRERLIQFKTNIDVVMSLLDRNGLGDWLAERLVEIGDTVRDDVKLRISATSDPFLDDRLRVANLPEEPQKLSIRNAISGAEKQVSIALFRKPGEVAGARRAISEIIKWMNYVTDGRFFTVAADLSESINVEHGSLWGHYSPTDESAGHALESADSGSGQCFHRHRAGEPKRQRRSQKIRRRLGAERHLWRVHAADVHAGACLEPAKSGQQIPHGRAAYSRRALRAGNRGRWAHPLRHLRDASVEAVPARPDDQSELLGLQRCCARLFRGGGDCGARSEGGHHHAGSGASRLRGCRPQPFRRLRSAGRGQRPVRDPRFRAGQAAPRLRDRAGIQFHGESGESAAETGSGRGECEGDRGDQRGLVRSPAASVSRFRAAARGSLRFDGGIDRHAAHVAAAQSRSVDG